jgi:hypothetical protein
MKKLTLLNSTVLTSNGIFSLKDISLEKARELVKENKSNILNCIEHEATANTLSKLLGLEIQYERNTLKQEKGQLALVLKLNGRVPENTILTEEEMEKMGYSLKLLEKIADE